MLISLEKEHGKKLKKLAEERPRGTQIYVHHGVDVTVRAALPIPDDERGIIDLLYRTDTGWCIIDFKTDEIRSEEETRAIIRRAGYDRQVARYAQAIENQLKVQAKTRLVFLNVKDSIAIFDL